MFTYRKFNHLEMIKYSDLDYVAYVDKRIVEHKNARFIKNGNISESKECMMLALKKLGWNLLYSKHV